MLSRRSTIEELIRDMLQKDTEFVENTVFLFIVKLRFIGFHYTTISISNGSFCFEIAVSRCCSIKFEFHWESIHLQLK